MPPPRSPPPLPAVSLISILLFALFILAPAVSASAGDRLVSYRQCVATCISAAETDPLPIPLHRRLLGWSTPSECAYTCQHIITSIRSSSGDPILQFHGKWPFHRVLGIQEPLSTLFSLGNLVVHRLGRARVKAAVPARHPMRRYYTGLADVAVVTWAFSAVFHTRDLVVTERLDYFGAAAGIVYGLWYAVIRFMGWEGMPSPSPSSSSSSSGAASSAASSGLSHSALARRRRNWTRICLAMYACHVGYLSLWRWDYGYNMAASVVVGMLGNGVWAAYGVRRYFSVNRVVASGSPSHSTATSASTAATATGTEMETGTGTGKTELQIQQQQQHQRTRALWPLLSVAAITMVTSAMALELFDFPPLGGWLDAHALWHAGTIVPTMVWYSFLVRDACWDVEVGLVPALPSRRD